MMTKSGSTFAALALAASIGFANAQTAQNAQDHEAHHPPGQAAPQAQTPAPMPGQRPMGPGPGGTGGGGMTMNGDMSQMMGMMQQMMRGGMMPMGAGPMGMGPGGRQPFRHIEGQLAFFRTELGITDAQLPQWNAFADVVRNNARQLQQAMTPPAQTAGPPSAPEQLERRATQLSAMLDATKAVLGAAKPLYVALSPEQKKTADELMAEHMMAMRMRGL
jgi:hypothetical protein